jgi:high-affinity iron transporter
MVLSMVVYMLKAARRMRSDIAAKVEAAVARPGPAAWFGVFAFVLVMIVREGMETALILSTLMFEQGSQNLLAGATIGVLLAALLAWAWSRFGQRVNLKRFFQVTSLFLVLFAIQLVIYAFHEFTEAGAVPGIDNEYWHLATEPYGPEGEWGAWLTYLMVLVPTGWLALAWWQDRRVSPATAPRSA